MPDELPTRYISCDVCGQDILPNHRLIINGPLKKRIVARFKGEAPPQVRYTHKSCVPDPGNNQTLDSFADA